MTNLLTLTPAEFCAATKACEEGREFALQYDTMADAWDNCPRPDWLLWVAHRIDPVPDDKTLMLFAVWCARHTPLGDGMATGDLLTDARSLAALEVAERYANGIATPEELAAAWGAGAAAWDAARDAAAWGAAAAAGNAAGNAAGAAARDAAGAAQATQLRRMVPNPFRSKEAKP